jgi:hypothetical protein
MKRIWKFSRPIKLTPSQIPSSQQGNPRQKPLNLNSASLPQKTTPTSRSSDANPSGTTTTVVIPHRRHMQSARNRSTRDLGLPVSRHDPGLKIHATTSILSNPGARAPRAGWGQAGDGLKTPTALSSLRQETERALVNATSHLLTGPQSLREQTGIDAAFHPSLHPAPRVLPNSVTFRVPPTLGAGVGAEVTGRVMQRVLGGFGRW